MILPVLRNGSLLLQQISAARSGRGQHTNKPSIAALIAAGMLLSVASVSALPGTGYAQANTATCTSPTFTTTKSDDMKTFGDYIVHNNMWNAGGYSVTQKLDACSAQKWNVTVTADNSKNDGAVKTYPNVHKDYHNWSTGAEPKVSSYTQINSTFGAVSPRAQGQIYNVAYDIWLNGVPGDREIMIWTDNWNQRPAGNKIGNVQVAGKTWEFWASGDNHILTFVAPQPLTSGSLDLKAILDWLIKEGRVPADATLGQIGYGVEVVSTNGQPATFNFTDFSITDSTTGAPVTNPNPTPTPTPAPSPSTNTGQVQGQSNQNRTTAEKDKYTEEIPSTGPEAALSALTGASALTYAALRYFRSRQQLNSAHR